MIDTGIDTHSVALSRGFNVKKFLFLVPLLSLAGTAKADEDPITTRKFESVIRAMEAMDRRMAAHERRINALDGGYAPARPAAPVAPPATRAPAIPPAPGCGCTCGDGCRGEPTRLTPTSLSNRDLPPGAVLKKAVLRP